MYIKNVSYKLIKIEQKLKRKVLLIRKQIETLYHVVMRIVNYLEKNIYPPIFKRFYLY
jgi:hypothetical protein